MNSHSLFSRIKESLNELYDDREAGSIAKLILEKKYGIGLPATSTTQVDVSENELNTIITLLSSGTPVQHVLGVADFYGYEFNVSPDVLIPRSETEELVHLILAENQTSNLRVLDIGTGSGCIAITLAMNLASANVQALDLSPKAIEVAKANACKLGATVEFHQIDILAGDPDIIKSDIIVSNPPYVRESEKGLMHKNVLQYEPATALFVDDKAPLVFYEKITSYAKRALSKYGKLYFEINEAFGEEVSDLLTTAGFVSVEIIKDLHGRDRLVRGSVAS